MINLNLRIALRNILRNKLYTAINIIGLGVACAFCILVYWYVQNERTFDKFHKDVAQIYRIEETNIFGGNKPKASVFSFLMKDDEQINNILTPLGLAAELKKNVPEIENTVRIKRFAPVIRVNNQSFKEDVDKCVVADKDFFKVFNFPLLYGNPQTALNNPKNIVIDERTAIKYFGTTNVVGRVVTLIDYTDSYPVTISGVAKNFPPNSSFQFNIIMPTDETSPNYIRRFKENSFNDILIVKINKNTNPDAFRRKLDAAGRTYFSSMIAMMAKSDTSFKASSFHVFARPFSDAHYNQSGSWWHYTDLKNIYELIFLAVVILVIACLNYILLTLTSALTRSQDVGIRKTIGAGRWQIIKLYYLETQLLAIVSVIIGLLLAVTFLPFFNSLTQADLHFGYLPINDVIISLIVLALLLGLVAGIYPAFTMSALKPLTTMRSFSAYKLNPVLSRVLVVVQFTVCVVLIISSLAINKQMRFINHADMGFDKDRVVILSNPFHDEKQMMQLKTNLAQYVSTQPALQDMTTVNFEFNEHNSRGFKFGDETDGEQVNALDVDYNYFKFNKIPIVEGRDFSRNIATDTADLKLPESETTPGNSIVDHAVVVNQTLYNKLGKPRFNEPNKTLGAVIIGVCKDYNMDDLTKKIAPAYHTVHTELPYELWVKIKAGQNIPDVMDNIHKEWNSLTNSMDFRYTFLDADVAKSYESYLRWMGVINTSCVIAIIIACLGLFGLSGLTTINRTKEIGIRKVLGASVTSVFMLINKGTLRIAIGAFVIAVPVAWYLVHKWLENFAYRTEPGWILFAVAGVITVITAVAAVSYHALRASLANPVDSLRSE